MIRHAIRFTLLAVLLHAVAAFAETAYVTHDLNVGLHQDKTLDSPITKLVPSGTALEVIKREDSLSFVREPEGATGWIDSSYLAADTPPSAEQLKKALDRGDALEKRLAEAQQQIAQLSGGKPAAPVPAGGDQGGKDGGLEQQLKEERLHSADLQVQLAELKKRLGVNSDNASLYQRISDLEADNKRLEVALSGKPDHAATPASGSSRPVVPDAWLPGTGLLNLLGGVLVILVMGFVGGLYFMDYLNRRRHGGFRV